MIFILIIRASGWDHQVEHQGPQSYRSKSRTVGEKKFSAAVVRPLITLRFVAPYSVEHAISPPNRGLLISTSARPYCITPSIRLKKKVHTASRTLFFFFSSSKTTPSNIFLSIYFYPLPSRMVYTLWNYCILNYFDFHFIVRNFFEKSKFANFAKTGNFEKVDARKKKRGENPRFVCNGKREKNNECL